MSKQDRRSEPQNPDDSDGSLSARAKERDRALFEHAPLAFWEYDYSKTKKMLDTIRASGVEDFKAYLDEDPDRVRELGIGIFPIDVNPEAIKMYAASTKQDLLDRDVTKLGPGMLAAAKRTILDIAAGKKEATFRTTTYRTDGTPMEVLVRWSVMPESYENYSRVLVFTLDVTESSAAARALEESEERFSAFMEHSPLGAHLYELREDGNLEFVGTNPAANRILHVDNSQFIGKTIEEAFPILSDTAIPQTYRECAAEGLTWTGQEIIYEDESDTISGAYDVHAFPIGENRMAALFLDATERIRQERELERYRGNLERLVAERTAELEHASRSLESITSIVTLMIEARDPYTAGHQYRVARLAKALAESLGFDHDAVEDLFIAAQLHDIGKISIPSDILNKPGKLSHAEFALMKDHPHVAYEILSSVTLRPQIAKAVHQHHERLDGSGYPNGISGDDVLMEARILAVADVTEAIASHRPYRPALGVDVAIDEIRTNRETLYDPAVVDACVELFENGFQFAEVFE